MAPILSSEGERINWVNYKTGEKDIRFGMLADTSIAKISISLSHKDIVLQELYFDKFTQLKRILQQFTGEEWIWQLHNINQHGKTISEIYTTLLTVNILHQPDWPGIISFLKPRIIALDAFWCENKYAFEGLAT